MRAAVVGIVALAFLPGCGAESKPVKEAARPSVADTWIQVKSTKPIGRQSLSTFWTGTEALIVAGATYAADGLDVVAYDPKSDNWKRVKRPPLGWRSGYSVVWTGQELLIWGGASNEGSLVTGAAYDHASGAWRSISRAPVQGPSNAAAVWTGKRMIVWGGIRGNWQGRSDGFAYDPRADSWRTIAEAPLEGRYLHSAVWTGREVLVWGGSVDPLYEGYNGVPSGFVRDGAAYEPATDSWQPIAPRLSPPRPSTPPSGRATR